MSEPPDTDPGPLYDEGDRVVLMANEAWGWPEQRGVCLGADWCGWGWCYTVELDEQYRGEDDPDGLRECTDDQMRHEVSA